MADIFYVESGYVDSGYFVYTADAASIVSASATLNCIAGVIKESSATVNSSATLSTNAGKDVVASATLAVTATLDANIVTTRGAASLVVSSGTLSARGNAIFELGDTKGIPGFPQSSSITGINVDSTRFATINCGQETNLAIGATISLWAKGSGCLYSYGLDEGDLSGGKPNNYTRLDTSNNGISITSNVDGIGSFTEEWTTTTDTNWHHYVLRRTGNATIELWKDGSSLGSKTVLSTIALGRITNIFHLGSAKVRSAGTTVARSNLWNGCFVQLWMGSVADGSFNINQFYNGGWVDLSSKSATFINNVLTYSYSGVKLYNYTGTGTEYGTVTTPSSAWICPVAGSKNLQATFTIGKATFGTVKNARFVKGAQASITKALGDVNVSGIATLNAITNLAVEARRLPGTGALLDVTTTLSASPNYIEQSSATLSVSASLSTSPTYAIFGSSTLAATSTVRTVTSAEATLAATVNVQVSPDKAVGGFATLAATFDMPTAIGGVNIIARANDNIHSQFTLRAKLTVVPKSDDLMTVFVPQDSRGLRILPETRFATVESESNLNRVLMETRDLEVPYESRQLREAVNPALEVTSLRIRRIPA